MIAQHSSKTNEHPTPKIVVEPARQLLGGFDLDPASCEEFNRTIRATRFFDQSQDGLSQPWSGNVWLNPPGGLLKLIDGKWVPHTGGGGESSMWVWWDRLSTEHEAGRVTAAFFVGFTLEILRTSQKGMFPVQRYPRCYPSRRLAFAGGSPTHANVLVYLPDKRHSYPTEHFRRLFSEIGFVEGGSP